MKINIKSIVIPVAIIGAGVAGFFIGKKLGKQEEEKKVQEAINNYKESYLKRRNEIEKYIDKKKDDEVVVDEAEPEVEEPTVRIISENEYAKGEMLKDFKKKKADMERKGNKYSRKHIDYDPEDEYYDDELDENGNPPGPSEGLSEPYPIPYDEYASENIHFDKKSVIYYEENDVLVYDDTDECILEDVQLFGDEWRELLDVAGTCFIRNEKLSTDFEIIKKEGAYVE